MEQLFKDIVEYKTRNNLTSEECAERLGLTYEELTSIEGNESIELNQKQVNKINKILEKSKISTGRRIIKSMDLIFRFVAMVMALVTLLLCINENIDTKVLIVLLSIGLVCSSMTILPKIDK